MKQIKWAIWSGEGEIGTKAIKVATTIGIKRILTKERCNGDRWAYACPADSPYARSAGACKDYYNNLDK